MRIKKTVRKLFSCDLFSQWENLFFVSFYTCPALAVTEHLLSAVGLADCSEVLVLAVIHRYCTCANMRAPIHGAVRRDT